jgi:hypothetical protein
MFNKILDVGQLCSRCNQVVSKITGNLSICSAKGGGGGSTTIIQFYMTMAYL